MFSGLKDIRIVFWGMIDMDEKLPDNFIEFDPQIANIVNVYGFKGGCQHEFIVPNPCGRILVNASPDEETPTVSYVPHSKYLSGITSYETAARLRTKWINSYVGTIYMDKNYLKY